MWAPQDLPGVILSQPEISLEYNQVWPKQDFHPSNKETKTGYLALTIFLKSIKSCLSDSFLLM